MAGPANQDQLNDITYESGVDASGNVATPVFEDWEKNAPPTYNTSKNLVGKWYNDANGVTLATKGSAGTASGVITYAFGAGVTPSQAQAFQNTLTLWSDEAGLTFNPSANSATADVLFNVTSSGGTFNNGSPHFYDTVGSASVSLFLTPTFNQGGQDQITFNNDDDFGRIGDFSTQGGYGVGGLTHEIGHMIGLGHSGPYNDGSGINQNTAQYNAFDSRQWSIMSYIDPSNPTATYYSQYTVTGTKWQSVSGNTIDQVAPETPMMDDILAAQRLYGLSSSTALSGGQVFGFNCNITDGSKAFFDFTQNVNPVITLYDTGTGNTFDCSGFSTNCTINLNPGTFSTASGGTLTNNIGIAYDTRIDTAIGGSGNDSFIGNSDGDVIDGGAGSNAVSYSSIKSNYTVTVTGNGFGTVKNNTTGVTDTLSNIQTLNFADGSVALVCFCTGTRIRTDRGTIAVEGLAVGDLAVTATGGLRPVTWIGHRTIDCASRPIPSESWPVRVVAGAFGNGLPARDLFLSPGHPVLVGAGMDGEGGHLVPIMCLVNGTTIERVQVATVTYWHVELDAHDILLAEGLPAESYLDWGDRAFFSEAVAHSLANPDFVVPGLDGRCRPVAIDGPLVEAERRRLDIVFDLRLGAACAWPEEGDALGV